MTVQGQITETARRYAVAAYNAGPGNVSRGMIPKSTRQYAQAVCGAGANWSPWPLPAGAPISALPELDWTAVS